MTKETVVALVGNPNSGKTSLFNTITGSRQHVGNWAGVTVERKEGFIKHHGRSIKMIDLPGTYSFSASSEDEIIAVQYILKDRPDAVINVIDAGNIERNLYLTLQLLEMNTNVILTLNMFDEAEKKGLTIDQEKLSSLLQVPVISTVATRNLGIDKLLDRVLTADQLIRKPLRLDYGKLALEVILSIGSSLMEEEAIEEDTAIFLALKLLEDDPFAKEMMKLKEKKSLQQQIEEGKARIQQAVGFEPEMYFADKRYEYINTILTEVVQRDTTNGKNVTDQIDQVVTHRIFGIPIFFLIMFLLYQITMGFGNEFLGSYVETGFVLLAQWASTLLAGAPELLRSFLIDAIIGGVGSVLVFVPLMFTMYFLISFLEDSGYMARAAYVMDRMMNAVGLHGKTAVAMIVGSGCNVAGIMATRTLDTKKDRMIGILISPFVSCSARLPVYALFAAAFFADKKVGVVSASGLVFFSLYLLGILVAILAGKVLSKTVFKGEKSYFVMELPPYRMPTLKSLFIHMWDKTESFVQKAGTVVFAIVVILWVLSVLPLGVTPGSAQSVLGMLGSFLAPVLEPAGFGSWEAAVALVVGVGAKEAIVATLGMVYGTGEESLVSALALYFTPLSAYAFMVMSLLYSPCAATIGIIKKETNSTRWAIFSVGYSLLIGWGAATAVYQVGRLMGLQ